MDYDFYASLPKKRMGAGCLISNECADILLVKPTYKAGWEIPGGIVEENESPRACCVREVKEELGLELSIGSLLVVDYNSYPESPEKTESLMFIFHGGIVTPEQVSDIHIQDEELAAFEFFSPHHLPDMSESLRRRIVLACAQVQHGAAIYTENGIRT